MKRPDLSAPPPVAGSRRNSDLPLRLGSALVLIPIALLAVWWGGVPAYALTALVAAIVYAEWCHITGWSKAFLPDRAIVWIGAAFVVVSALVGGMSGAALGVAVALGGTVLMAGLSRSAWLATGSVYAGLFGVSLAALRHDEGFGLQAVLVLLVVVWATDSCAYFVGRSVGGPKLWQRVSPKKTWSGSIGGLVGGVALAAIAAKFAGIPVGAGLIVMLVVLSIVSQIGDLVESAIKRRFDKKDSSHIIPGHGGMMDRVDGLLFASIAAFVVGWIHAGPDSIGGGMLLW